MDTSNIFNFEWLDNLFEVMLNLSYKLAMVPYRIEYNEKQGTYSVITESGRKVNSPS